VTILLRIKRAVDINLMSLQVNLLDFAPVSLANRRNYLQNLIVSQFYHDSSLRLNSSSALNLNKLSNFQTASKTDLIIIFPGNAFNRARLYRFFDTLLRSTLRQYDLRLFLIFIKSKYFRAQFNTGLAPGTFIGIYYDAFSHIYPPWFSKLNKFFFDLSCGAN
jgi:hypothetical protein